QSLFFFKNYASQQTLSNVLNPSLPESVRAEAQNLDFKWTIAPVAFPGGNLSVSFDWPRAVGHDTYSDRFLRFAAGPRKASPVMVERPVRVVIYLPAHSVISTQPTDSHVTFGNSGVQKVVIPVAAADQAVELDWSDQEALGTRDRWLLLSGVALGVM